MHYLDSGTRRLLMREHGDRLAAEMRRARGPVPSEGRETAWMSRLPLALAASQRLRRAEETQAPAYES
jgi:hypothetical protein